ncbi:MAG: hypothetical protein ACFFDH_09805 [Promethearchaeota archaeon]
MKQVKGSILITVVKGIKANHQKKDKYYEILSDDAKELLKGRILTGTWYPFDEYRKLNDALCFIDAKNDPKTLHEWGRNDAKRSFTTVYQSTIVKGDLQASVEGYLRFH